jgi:hypothetical protein
MVRILRAATMLLKSAVVRADIDSVLRASEDRRSASDH